MDNEEYYKKSFDDQFNKCKLNKSFSLKYIETKRNILCSSAVAFAEQELAKIMYPTFVGFAAIGVAVIAIAVSILNSIDKTQDFVKGIIFIGVLIAVFIIITIVFYYRMQANKKVIGSILKYRGIDDAIKCAELFNDNTKKHDRNFQEYYNVQIHKKDGHMEEYIICIKDLDEC